MEITKVEKTQRLKEALKSFFTNREKIQSKINKNYRNETQAIDSEKQIIEENSKSSSYKEHKVNALASEADEGRD